MTFKPLTPFTFVDVKDSTAAKQRLASASIKCYILNGVLAQTAEIALYSICFILHCFRENSVITWNRKKKTMCNITRIIRFSADCEQRVQSIVSIDKYKSSLELFSPMCFILGLWRQKYIY